jgi:isopenicillin N synthase-like dioxygenase
VCTPPPSTSTPSDRRAVALSVVPTIDLRRPVHEVAPLIDAACREIGFLQVIGHGLDPEVEDRAWRCAHRFFALPDEDKLSVSIPPGDAYGYGPYRVERLAASLGADTPPDLKETFSIGPFTPAPADLDDPAAAFVYSPNRWPAALPDMADTFHRCYDALAALVARLMAAMAVGLGLDEGWFEPFIDRHTSALRILHYPDLRGESVEPGQLRAGAHADYGTLTLLRQDDAPGGLQVLDVHHEWHDVPAVPGAYVVNVGDALARWTNDRWRSTVHRVVVPPSGVVGSSERFSLAFFHNANWDAPLDVIPTCVPAGEPPRYERVLAGRHLMDKFRSTQPSDG